MFAAADGEGRPCECSKFGEGDGSGTGGDEGMGGCWQRSEVVAAC